MTGALIEPHQESPRSGTGARFRELGRDTVVYGLTNAVSKSIAILLIPIYTRVFTPAEFGILDILVITASLLNLLMQVELNSALARYFYEYKEDERSDVVSTIFWAVAALGLITAAAGFLISGAAAKWFADPAMPSYLRIVIGTALGASTFALASLQLRLERRSLRYGGVHLLSVLVAAGLSIFLVVGLRWGIRGALWGHFWGSWVGAAAALFSIRNYIKASFHLALLRRSLRFSLPTIPGIAAGWIRRYGDRWVILMFLSAHALGIYALGAKIAMIPTLLTQSLTLSWLPFSMSLLRDPNQKEIYARSLRYYVLIMGSVAVLVAGASPELVALLGTGAYAGAHTIVGWLAGAAIVSGAGLILWVGAMVKERTEVSSIASWAAALAVLGLMALLVPLFSIEGAAVAVFAGSLVQITVLYRLSQRLHRIEFAVGRAMGFVGLYVVFMGLLHIGARLSAGADLALRSAGALAFIAAAWWVLLDVQERMSLRQAFLDVLVPWHSTRTNP